MLTPDQIERFHQDGFLNSGPVLRQSEVDEITEGLEEILEIGPDGFAEGRPRPVLFHDMKSRGGGVSPSPVWQIVNIWEASPAFERLIHHPFVVKAVSQLTGQRDLQVWHDQIQYKPAAAGGPTNWHQDAPLWPIIKPMTPVSAWIPMDDADEENGCMWMVPGSHRWGNQIEFLRTQRHLESLADFSAIEGFEPPDGTDVTAGAAAALAGAAGGDLLPPLPDLARLAPQHLGASAAGDRHPLHDRRGPLRRQRQPRDETVRRAAGRRADGRGGTPFPGRLPLRPTGRRAGAHQLRRRLT